MSEISLAIFLRSTLVKSLLPSVPSQLKGEWGFFISKYIIAGETEYPWTLVSNTPLLKFLRRANLNLCTNTSNGIPVATFYEPDLNDMLSGIVWIADERVFNNKDYPQFFSHAKSEHV